MKIRISRNFIQAHKNNRPVASLWVGLKGFIARAYDRRGYVKYTLVLWGEKERGLFKGHKRIV